MKQSLFAYFFTALFASQVQAWNAPIHMAVVELALDQMAPRQARHFNEVAYDLIVELGSERRLTLMRQYQDTSWLAQLSVLPDWDRGILLEDLFNQYDLELPEPLAEQRDQDTSSWHFINRALASVPGATQCNLGEPDNLVSVFPLLLESYEQADSDKERALLLAFITHLVADVHQPLHNVTHATADCQHDLGGNLFCAARRTATERCEESLHQLWDHALGLFDEQELVEEIAHRISLATPPETSESLNIADWNEESYRFGQLVYSASQNRNPDSNYLREGRAVAADQLNLAAMRLSRVLQAL